MNGGTWKHDLLFNRVQSIAQEIHCRFPFDNGDDNTIPWPLHVSLFLLVMVDVDPTGKTKSGKQ